MRHGVSNLYSGHGLYDPANKPRGYLQTGVPNARAHWLVDLISFLNRRLWELGQLTDAPYRKDGATMLGLSLGWRSQIPAAK